MHYRKEIEVAPPAPAVFEYVSDFSHSAEWDPGVVESRRLDSGLLEVGSRFEILALFRGRTHRFEYVITALEPGRRVALAAEGEKARSRDTMTVEQAGTGARVAYEAEVQLKGFRRIAEPLLGRTFRRLGDDALDGLKAKLDGSDAPRA